MVHLHLGKGKISPVYGENDVYWYPRIEIISKKITIPQKREKQNITHP